MRIAEYYTTLDGKIGYKYNMLKKNSKIKVFDTEEKAIEQLAKDLDDDKVVRIENFSDSGGIWELIAEAGCRPRPEQLDGYDYYYDNSKYAYYYEDRDLTLYFPEDLKLNKGDTIIIEENVEPEEEDEPTVFLYSVEQDRYVGHSFMTWGGDDSLRDCLGCIGAILAQEGFIDIGIYFPL